MKTIKSWLLLTGCYNVEQHALSKDTVLKPQPAHLSGLRCCFGIESAECHLQDNLAIRIAPKAINMLRSMSLKKIFCLLAGQPEGTNHCKR